MDTEKDVKYTVLNTSESSKLKKLLTVYKKDPFAARVIFFNSDSNEFFSSRLVMFEHKNGDFQICVFKKTFGVSITNRIYSREKKMQSITYSKKRFYTYSGHNNKLTQLTYNNLENFILYLGSYGIKNLEKDFILDILIKKFSWIRFILENGVLHSTAFTTFIRYKLFNLKDALRHIFKCPYPVIEVILSDFSSKTKSNMEIFGEMVGLNDQPNSTKYINRLKRWKSINKYLINIENLTVEMLNHSDFNDACRMAKILDKKINCSWSISRLVGEHDKWSKEITHIVLSNEEKYDLKIADIYREFAEFSGYKMLTTNIDLLNEGMIQKHCVGTYIDSVNKGRCAIFHIEGFTLEIRYNTLNGEVNHVFSPKELIQFRQFKGKGNSSAPLDLTSKVKGVIEEFNRVLNEKMDNKFINPLLDNKESAEQLINIDDNDALAFGWL